MERLSERHDEPQKFDFNVGYLVKSPCRDCPKLSNLPDCSEACETLNKIQAILADSISSANNFSAAEFHPLPPQVLEQI
ncbi:MAG: hypothetical protein JSW39_26740 [Desulfobacterales bacterium]|nr:MAG: hypothetical protein JSW39_26740 [Desulfobacterales bacterium]